MAMVEDKKERQKEAVKKYQEKLDEIKVRPPKGTKARWTAAAEVSGKSLQRFIIDAVEAAIAARD